MRVFLALLIPTLVHARFQVLPYLQNPSDDGVSIIWFAESGGPGTVIIEGVGSFESTAVRADLLDYSQSELDYIHGDGNDSGIHRGVSEGDAPAIPYRHRVRVDGLSADHSYAYTVKQPGNETQFNAVLTTAPKTWARAPVKFVVMADMETEPESTGKHVPWPASDGHNGGDKLATDPKTYARAYPLDQTDGYRENLKMAAACAPDFWLIAGDLVEKGGRQLDWDEFWRHAAGEWGNLASRVPIFPAMGNHENFWHPSSGGYSADAVKRAYDKWHTYWELPPNNASDRRHEKRYYRIDYGPVTLITLDSSNGNDSRVPEDTNLMIDGAPSHVPDFNPGSEQWKWAEAQLSQARKAGQLLFVQWHHMAFGTGAHSLASGTAGIPNNEDTQSGAPMRVYHRMMAEHGVIAVFSGHDELLEYVELDGVHYWDVGFAGDGLRGPGYAPKTLYVPFDLLPEAARSTHWSAHGDAPEIWQDDRLVAGGKHYGFLEVEVRPAAGEVASYEIIMTPRYTFPLMDPNGQPTGEYELRTYEKVVRVLHCGAE